MPPNPYASPSEALSREEAQTDYRLVETADGSLSCIQPDTGEWYHNRAGAYAEALHHYVEPSGYRDILARRGEIQLLDVCFGLGYNTWVLWEQLQRHVTEVSAICHVTGLELDRGMSRLWPRILKAPHFTSLKDVLTPLEHNAYYRTSDISSCDDIQLDINPAFSLRIHWGDLLQTIPKLAGPFDLIFHDPFSLRHCPHLWTQALFEYYYRLLLPVGGKLLTYSTARLVREHLQAAGFQCFQTPPLGGKRGGTLALTQSEMC